ncbi:alpha-L-rhamnosidase [Thermomonospora echinospora]|uniref:Alpha-L-rhamnosidase n=1 Tax=Thermomonospora echinospora TaxID=1992 RepID=A0A1H6E8D6_9ACTN|nr:hypothetical protein [Thermomonospora echinospora]SEG93992.1 alpha-L-rhamnosidase [Thermomonospora echinospora]
MMVVFAAIAVATATATAWSDAAMIVPWTLYQRYGDLGVLERQSPWPR